MEMKFRAWHKEAKKMLYGSPKDVFAWQDMGQPVDIMQYTGQKDKNGKEIYVGDRVIDDYGETWEVIFNDDNSCFCLCLKNDKVSYYSYFDLDDSPADELQVIGHIYETQN